MRLPNAAAICGGLAVALMQPTNATAVHSRAPTCLDEPATIVVAPGDPPTHGTSGRDVVVVRPRSEVPARVRVGGGDDLICGVGELFGGRGDDRFARTADSCPHGGLGRDTLVGGPGQNCLRGERGDDVARGRAGRDTLFGGPGDDVLFGGAGRDHIIVHGPQDVRVDLRRGVARGLGTDRLHSVQDASVGRGDNLVIGTDAVNLIDAQGTGDNRLYGRGGDDYVFGGRGEDDIRGGRGDDTLNAEPGDDTLRGGAGVDEGDGGPGTDRCSSVEAARLCER